MLKSQEMRRLAPEMDPLRLGSGWMPEDLGKPQVLIESTFGDSHPGSAGLDKLVEAARKGVRDGGSAPVTSAPTSATGRARGLTGSTFPLFPGK